MGRWAEWAAVQALWRERSDKAAVGGFGMGCWTEWGVWGGPGLSQLRGRPCGNPPVLWDLPPTLEALPAVLKTLTALPRRASLPPYSSGPRSGGGQQGGWTWEQGRGWGAGLLDLGQGGRMEAGEGALGLVGLDSDAGWAGLGLLSLGGLWTLSMGWAVSSRPSLCFGGGSVSQDMAPTPGAWEEPRVVSVHAQPRSLEGTDALLGLFPK